MAYEITNTYIVRINNKWQKLYKCADGQYFTEATHIAGSYLGYLQPIPEETALKALE